ncbi:uncharacterized protein LOC134701233 [Mytilus trossulus]|uniref:uncharacterized protein LOC134701233 n=1 Tax=Mytilus trossulus TaxID=6551 RepID=UPI003005FA8E
MTLRQYYRLLLGLIGFNVHGQRVSLSLSTDTISIGKDIVLTCRVHGIPAIDRKTTRQWSMGDDDKLLCYNGQINNPKKYEESVLLGNEFGLTIFNVTESDLNVVYQCRYGFDAASKLIEAGDSKLCLSLRLETDLIVFGGFIILKCTINGITTLENEVTRQWSMGNDDHLLSYNGRINNHRKYEETIFPGNEFSLKIVNVTEQDVNITYRCRYGFNAANRFIAINENNFVYLPTHASTIISYVVRKQIGTVDISVYFKRVFPLPNCSLNIDDSHFGIADFSTNEMAMEVNLSISLQKNVSCYHSFNISCCIAGTPYHVGNLKINDECPFKGKIDTKSSYVFTLIPIACIVMLGLVTVYLIVKGLAFRKRKHTGKETKDVHQKNDENITKYENLIAFPKGQEFSTCFTCTGTHYIIKTIKIAESENEDVLLLQDEENDIDNEADGYDFQHLYVANEIKNDDLNRKTRGSVNKPPKKPNRIRKGTAITSDKAPKSVKRKAKATSATSKATKSPRVEDLSSEELSVLRDKMGISTMGKSIDTLTHLFRGFINNCGKEPVRAPRCETVSQSSIQAEVVNPAAVSSNTQILHLEVNLNADSVQDFDLDYLEDPVYLPPSGVSARADDSPAPVDFDTSFDPPLGFSNAFRTPLSEVNVPQSQPVVEQVEQYDYDFAWEIPQLNMEETTGPKLSSGFQRL